MWSMLNPRVISTYCSDTGDLLFFSGTDDNGIVYQGSINGHEIFSIVAPFRYFAARIANLIL